MNEMFTALEGCLKIATLKQTDYATGAIGLFKSSFDPTPASPLADFVTNECDFTGYTTGGITTTAWNDPILSTPEGYQISSPLVQWVVGTPVVTGNVVGGWFFIDTDGDLITYGVFGTPQPMQVTGQGIDLYVTDITPTGG